MNKIKLFILGCLFPIFLLLFTVSVSAASWRFVWSNTTVHIPVGGSIEKYKNVPTAKLYKDNVLCTNSQITYNTEGDWLYYFKDINPYKVGEYNVWYKAYDSVNSPGTCTGYKALITFVVEDTIAPTIQVYSPIYRVPRGSEYDLTKNFYAMDNYELKNVELIHEVNTMVLGEYEVKVVAIDTSGNKRIERFTVLVYSDSFPSIFCTEVGDIIEIPYKGEYDIKEFFSASDVVDGDISDRIYYPEIKNTELCEYPYTVHVTNLSGLTTEYPVTIRVVDKEKPILTLTTHALVLDYETNLYTIDFSKYIKELKDNLPIKEENLKTWNNLENKVGSYSIWYSYFDGKYTVEDNITVTMVSTAKPVINVEDIIIYVDSNINLKDYITVTDVSDPNVMNSIEIYDSLVDYTKEGTYYAEVFCMNSSGLSETKRICIVIKDNSWFSKTNAPFAISMIVSIVIALGLIGFIVFYFFFKKKIK